jgi:hypothetical protein
MRRIYKLSRTPSAPSSASAQSTEVVDDVRGPTAPQGSARVVQAISHLMLQNASCHCSRDAYDTNRLGRGRSTKAHQGWLRQAHRTCTSKCRVKARLLSRVLPCSVGQRDTDHQVHMDHIPAKGALWRSCWLSRHVQRGDDKCGVALISCFCIHVPGSVRAVPPGGQLLLPADRHSVVHAREVRTTPCLDSHLSGTLLRAHRPVSCMNIS